MSAPSKGDIIGNFLITDVTELSEYNSLCVQGVHRGTRTPFCHIVNDDIDNLFAFAFKTPPADSTGVAHIMEHSVLCGSKRFPVKDPFLHLLKSSMNTFMNAFTFPDKTVYPASSTIKNDYFNLMDVYGDAVFFPLLKKEVFLQEGHRLEFDDADVLKRVGVVFNEMKGNYSSQESIAGEWSYRSLFTDSPYKYDSGGDPLDIPDLTYQQFLDFHKDYYHPSNCRIFLYGNIDTGEQLSFIDERFLSKFDVQEVPSQIPRQSGFTEEVVHSSYYPVAEDEDTKGKTTISLNWLIGPTTDPLLSLGFDVLAEILLGHSGSPLEKAVIDSGIGEDISTTTGLETELLEMCFSVGVRGSDDSKIEDLKKLVTSTLENLVSNGIDRDLIEGAMHYIEFRSSEIKAGNPFGQRLMRRALKGWLHGRNPLESLVFESTFNELKQVVKTDDRYFEHLIERYLLQNVHRSVSVTMPEKGMSERLEKEELDSLASLELSDEQKSAILEDSKNLKAFQEEDETDDALASIPRLTLKDVPRKVHNIENEVFDFNGIEAVGHDLFTNDILYFDMVFDISHLSVDELKLMPLYSSCISGLGVEDIPYHEFARKLALCTGSYGAHLEANSNIENGTAIPRIVIRLKALENKFEESAQLISKLLQNPDFNDSRRINDLYLEFRNDIKSAIIPSGHSFIMGRTQRVFSGSAAIEDLWHGVDQYLFLAPGLENVGAKLAALHDRIWQRKNLVLHVTAPKKDWNQCLQAFSGFVQNLPASQGSEIQRIQGTGLIDKWESFIIPAQVNFASVAVKAAKLGSEKHALDLIIAHILKTGYLWEEVRMKSGAYGAFANASGMDGVFAMGSYRDPQGHKTIATFLKAFDKLVPSADELEDAVMSIVGKELRPYGPATEGAIGLRRHLYGISDELRQHRRDSLLSASRDAVLARAAELADAFRNPAGALLGNEKSVNEAESAFSNFGKGIVLPF